MNSAWRGLAVLTLLATACSSGQKRVPSYPEYLPPTASEPVLPGTPRAVLPNVYTPRKGATGVEPAEAPLPARDATTCFEYCRLVTRACEYHESKLFGSNRQCMAQRRDWDRGALGDRTGNTLSCRLAWAQQADGGHPEACWRAAPASAPCVLGQVGEIPPPIDRQSPVVLGLYDSTDGRSWGAGRRARSVILGRRVTMALRKLGLRIEFHDVSKGLPPRASVERARAIVTSFYDPDMVGAREYVSWLRAQLEAGRRVAMLNDFGAWREKSDGTWLSDDAVNVVLQAIGLRYRGEWTNDGRVLTISQEHVDQEAFHRVPSPRQARHYYLFSATAPDARVHLGVMRKDLADSLSAVVMSSPRGGMALTRYYESKDGDEFLNLERFLSAALLE